MRLSLPSLVFEEKTICPLLLVPVYHEKMQISLPCLIFLLKKLSYLLYWYSMKGCGSPYPPWFFGKDWVASYVDIAWKDADFPTLLEFFRPFFWIHTILILRETRIRNSLPSLNFRRKFFWMLLYSYTWPESLWISLHSLIFLWKFFFIYRYIE